MVLSKEFVNFKYLYSKCLNLNKVKILSNKIDWPVCVQAVLNFIIPCSYTSFSSFLMQIRCLRPPRSTNQRFVHHSTSHPLPTAEPEGPQYAGRGGGLQEGLQRVPPVRGGHRARHVPRHQEADGQVPGPRGHQVGHWHLFQWTIDISFSRSFIDNSFSRSLTSLSVDYWHLFQWTIDISFSGPLTSLSVDHWHLFQ